MSKPAIQANRLLKQFDNTIAIDQLDLTIPTGSIYGLLGTNGAGKTTFIRMTMGHLHLTAGDLKVLEQEPCHFSETLRKRIAYVSENMQLPGHMTPEKAVAFGASVYTTQWDAPLADTLLKDFDLAGKGPFKTLSKGQKRKTCILLAICQNADLLVMDEPAAGLDVVSRREFLDQVLEIACRPGRTVLISSHLLSDLERVVDRLAMILQATTILLVCAILAGGARTWLYKNELPYFPMVESFELSILWPIALASVITFHIIMFLTLWGYLGNNPGNARPWHGVIVKIALALILMTFLGAGRVAGAILTEGPGLGTGDLAVIYAIAVTLMCTGASLNCCQHMEIESQ